LPELKIVLPNAKFVIEGYVGPREPLRDEGPFGDTAAPECPQVKGTFRERRFLPNLGKRWTALLSKMNARLGKIITALL
jgi:hypothetical protein